MGLLSILKKVKEKERELRILVLGLDNAGKTTVLRKFTGEDVSTVEPTLGFSIKTVEHMGFRLNVWDVGGQRSIRAYWRNYFESTDGVVWVVDSTDVARLKEAGRELAEVLGREELGGASVLILANKQDVGGALGSEEIREALGLMADEGGGSCGESGTEIGKDRHWAVFACSAITGEGLAGGMDWLVGDISERIFLLS